MPIGKYRFKITRLKAPAKINIGLRILSKRKDGYHNLETIFYPVNLCDNITLRVVQRKSSNLFSVVTDPKGLIPCKDNICYKAISSFFKEFDIKGFYNIYITVRKNIPIGAGLGGGSSDAVAVLRGLYEHFNINGGEDKLRKIALELGSDVPFFLINEPAYAELRGEKLTQLKELKIYGGILLVYPGIHISTKWAFQKLGLKKSKQREIYNLLNISRPFEFYSRIIENPEIFENDFEKVVFKKYPEIKSIKEEMLKHGAVFASMSGSGSSVYGIFKKIPTELKGIFKEKGYKVFKG